MQPKGSNTFANLVPLHWTKGLPKVDALGLKVPSVPVTDIIQNYDESWVSYTENLRVQIHEIDMFAKLSQKLQQQLIREYNRVDWRIFYMGNKGRNSFLSRSADSLIKNFNVIDQLLSIPPTFGNKRVRIWREMAWALKPRMVMRRSVMIRHRRGLLVNMAYLLL